MLDFFMNLALGVLVLLIITIVLINTVTKKDDGITAKADIMIIMDWPDESVYDLDLHIRTPSNDNVFFRNKEVGYAVLDRDDLGQTNDIYQTPDGRYVTVLTNREVLTLRKPLEGEYTVSAHLYSTQNQDPPELTEVKIEIIELNPFRVAYSKKMIFDKKNQEIHIANFTVEEYRIKEMNFEPR